MNKVPFTLTLNPVSVSGGSGVQRQALTEAIDVSMFCALDLVLHIQGCTFSAGYAAANFGIITSTTMDDFYTGWMTLCTFAPVLFANTTRRRFVSNGILGYMRWFAVNGGGSILMTIDGFGYTSEGYR
jgi:hypothetical protein